MTKDGSNACKQAARELAEAEEISYTEALRRIDQRAAPAPSIEDKTGANFGAGGVSRARITRPVATLTPDVTLVGHTGFVNAVAFHPDGHTLASGGDVTARLWDLDTRQTTTVLTDENSVMSVAVSPDGRTLAVASVDGAVSLWRIATGKITTLTGSTGHVRSVAFSPDGRTLAGSEDQPRQPGQPALTGPTIRLWDLATGEDTVLSCLPGGYGHGLAFHPDGHTLASSAGMDGTARLLNLATGQSTALAGHTAGIETVAFSPDGRTLATGSVDATIRLWDLATGQTTTTLSPHGGYVVAVAFSPDGRILATASTDSTIRLWDPATGHATAALHGHTDFAASLTFSPDGHTLATGGHDRTIRLWTLS